MTTLPRHLSQHWSRYWTLWCVSPSNDRLRYQHRSIPPAEAFCTQSLSDAGLSQHHLLSLFQQVDSPAETQAQAGLCLRCYVSDPILKACQKIDSLFSGNKAFSYQDLLPFVLNDDGQQLVVLDEANNTQQVLDSDNRLHASDFKIFGVEVLRTYKVNLSDKGVSDKNDSGKNDSPVREPRKQTASMSLDNWAFLRTKQHPDLKSFLAEYGFKPYSDWTLLNRIQQNQMARLTPKERQIVEAFHAVYRRDRRANKQYGRCTSPTTEQLTEMNQLLESTDDAFESTATLLKAINQITKQLRTFDIWNAREPLEIKDRETGDYTLRVDLPTQMPDESEIEEQDFLAFLQQQLTITLREAIEQAVQARIKKLKRSKRYSPFAASYVLGLQRYYQEGISLREIGTQLGMSSWDQTRRILNPGELISQVRQITAQQLLDPILKKAQTKGLATVPADPSYLRTLMEQIETFIDSKLFSEAVSETKAGKNRSLDSDYAKALTHYLETAL